MTGTTHDPNESSQEHGALGVKSVPRVQHHS
jgi:hypothetical protein